MTTAQPNVDASFWVIHRCFKISIRANYNITKTITIEGGIALRKTAKKALPDIKAVLLDKYCMIDKEGIDDTSEDYSSLMIEILQRNNFRTMAEYEMTIDEVKLDAELFKEYEEARKEATNRRKNKCEVPE